MKIIFNIEVGVDVANFTEAGEILDKITKKLEKTIAPNGRYDIGNFQTRHRNVRGFDEDQAMMVEAPVRDMESMR